MAKTEHEILSLELKMRSQPAQRPVILETTLGKARRRSLDHQLEIGRWFNRQREFTRTIELISLPVSLLRQDLFLVRLDALAALGRWTEVRQNLDEKQIPIDALLAGSTAPESPKNSAIPNKRRCIGAREHGTGPTAASHPVRRPVRGAHRRKERSDQGVSPADPTDRLDATSYDALIRLAEKEGDTRGLREIMKELVALYPDDPTPKKTWPI